MAEIYKGKIMFAVGERIECNTHVAVCTPCADDCNGREDCVFGDCNLCADVVACFDFDRRDGVCVYFPYVRKEVHK